MSYYETYEFFALERRLTTREMAALRDISSRAIITPTRFWNFYNWGGLKGDPREMLRRWFDLFVYQEMNSGVRWGMLRFPADRVDVRAWRPYVAVQRGASPPASCASVATQGRVTVLTVTPPEGAGLQPLGGRRDTRPRVPDRADEEDDEDAVDADWDDEEDEDSCDAEDGDRAFWGESVDEASWPVPLALVRADLLAGDLRALYFLWLAGVQCGDRRSATPEPPRPDGLDRLTGTLYTFAEFLRLDPDLLAAAAEDRPAKRSMAPRTAGTLLHAARARIAERRRVAAARAAAERERRLTALAGRQHEEWAAVERLVDAKQVRAYEDAVGRLRALRELHVDRGTVDAFHAQLRTLLDAHRRKYGFLERVRQAKLLPALT
jgi:hypothetical protein